MRTSTRTAHARRAARTHRVARRTERAVPVRAAVVPGPGRAPQAQTAVRLTRRGRVLALLVLAGLLFAAFSLGRSGSSMAATERAEEAPVVQTTVQPGESLWTVASRVAPQSDPREVVQQIRRLNDLSGSGLQAGQQLLLPA